MATAHAAILAVGARRRARPGPKLPPAVITASNPGLRIVKRPKALALGQHVHVQNQTGNTPKRWDKRGVVVESKGHDQYDVRLDGSRRLTLRNRKYLRPFHPAAPDGQARLPAPQRQEPVNAPEPQPEPARQEYATPAREGHARPDYVTPARQPQPARQEYATPAREGHARPDYATPARLDFGTPARQENDTPARQEFATPPASPVSIQPEVEPAAAAEPEARWPTRERRPPAWQRSGEWDTSTHSGE